MQFPVENNGERKQKVCQLRLSLLHVWLPLLELWGNEIQFRLISKKTGPGKFILCHHTIKALEKAVGFG